MYEIMHNLRLRNKFKPGQHQKNQCVKHFIFVPSMALYGAGN